MARAQDRTLIIIGGHEDRTGERVILKEVAQRARPGRLVVTTVASKEPGDLFEEYERAFRALGVRSVYRLNIESREDAVSDRSLRPLQDASVVFFTGGDQLKITSQIGDTPVYARIKEIYESGGTIAGTSAGASAMTETMMVSGNGEQSPRIGAAIQMAPGLGLLQNVIVDQHFAERGRIGRLLAAVAQNPRILGIGIDENTAVIVRRNRLCVVGEGGVHMVDGRGVTYTNLTEEERDRTLSVFDAKLHLLSQGDEFDLTERRPTAFPAESALEVAEKEETVSPGV